MDECDDDDDNTDFFGLLGVGLVVNHDPKVEIELPRATLTDCCEDGDGERGASAVSFSLIQVL